jgi:transposase-like protein
MNASTPAESKPQPADSKRRQWSEEERDLIVRASLKKGTTVNAVARLYGVQPWQIYDWRKKARLVTRQTKAATLVPVQMTEPDKAELKPKQSCSVVIETERARITLTGLIDSVLVRTVLECLAR